MILESTESISDLPTIDELNRFVEQVTVSETRANYNASQPEPARFKNLVVYQAALDLIIDIYAVSQAFPKEESYGLTSQLRRSAVSISLNIAEGWARNGRTEFARFCDISRASLHEVDAVFDIAKRLGYVKEKELGPIFARLNRISTMLLKLAARLRST